MKISTHYLCGSQASSWALLSSEPVAQGLPAHPGTSPVALQGHTLSHTVSHCLTLVCLLLWLSGFQLGTAELRACGSGPASSPRHIYCGPSGPHTVSHCLTLSHTASHLCVCLCGCQASSSALLRSEPVAQGLPPQPGTSTVALQGHTLSLTVSYIYKLLHTAPHSGADSWCSAVSSSQA